MTSPFVILENGRLDFSRPLTAQIDPATGNEIPAMSEPLRVACYFKKMSPRYIEGKGIDTSTFSVTGYAVEPQHLPEWCKNTLGKVPCWVQGVGRGFFRWEPKLHVVKDLVESVAGTQLQGTFVLEGGFNEAQP